MREGQRLSIFVFLCGLTILFLKCTQMKVDFIGMVALCVCVTLWCHGQLRRSNLRLVQIALLLGLVAYSVFALAPLGLPMNPISQSLYAIDRSLLAETGAGSFFKEVIAYVTDPNKLDFYHWQYLWLLSFTCLSEGLYWLVRLKQVALTFLIAMGLSAFLWFTYLDVWLVFSCFFIAYAIERLTRNGKGALFAIVLPLGVAVAALLATTLTPINAINQWFSPLTSESGWLRSSLNLSSNTGGFGLAEMGFYPLESRLGGPIKLNKEIVFRVKSAKPKIYLRGRVLTHYENNLWTVKEEAPKNFYTLSGQLSETFTYQIYDLKSRTGSVMVPMTVSTIDIPQKNLKYGKDGTVLYLGNLKSDFKEGFNVSGYEVSYIPPNNPAEYLQLPKGYSKKVVSLTQEIIQGAKTDEERVKRIRKFLINNYQYALAVPVTPEDQDFVEYFLTETNSGYCVYFASATAVMARIAGVPSRYVEGFVTPETYEAGLDFPVSGERAHAWTEVYYNHKWQVIEATPTFTSRTSFDNEDFKLKSDLLGNSIENLPGKTEKDMAVTLPTVKEGGSQSGNAQSLWLFIVLLVALSVLTIHLRFRAYFKGSTKEKGEKYVSLLLWGLVRRFDLRDAKHLSPREIIKLSDRSAPSLNLMGLVEIVEKSLYDNREITEIELEQLTRVYWQLNKSHFSGMEKLYWYLSIAGKGRIFNGHVRKNSTS